MPVVMLVAAAAVLVGVVVVALGRGGELSFFQADYVPLGLEQVGATDVALFRPPVALWGYNTQATDEALNRIAEALTERDIRISALEQRVADLEQSGGTTAWPRSPYGAALPSRNPRGAAPAAGRDALAGETPPAPDLDPPPTGSPWPPPYPVSATTPLSPRAAQPSAAPDDVLSRQATQTPTEATFAGAGLNPPARG